MFLGTPQRCHNKGAYCDTDNTVLGTRYERGSLLFRPTVLSYLLNGAPDTLLDGGLFLAGEDFRFDDYHFGRTHS